MWALYILALAGGVYWLFRSPSTSASSTPPAPPISPPPVPPSVSDGGPSSLVPTDAETTPVTKIEVTSLLDKTPRKLPAGSSIRQTSGGAEAPLDAGERVVFDVEGPDHSALLEGVYEGPAIPSFGTADVIVDRTADVKKGSFALGRYVVPASKFNTYHSYVERVIWYALAPSSVGLSTFKSPPDIDEDNLVTVAVRDQYGNQVVAICLVETVDDASGKMIVRPLRPYRVLVDEGVGRIIFPTVPAQARIAVTNAQLVDPKSL